MKRSARLFAALALGAFFAGTDTASAGWNNVFQTTCNSCRSNTSSSYFAPCPTACPTISYQQRSYYQSVTTYKTETYMEPVTSYRTSYYWEPVTSYRYTSYYDPCTGCCQRVATPHTSYKLRSQCNAVQSYVQRCRLVPVQEMRQSFYYEPVITYAAPACPTSTPAIIESAPTAPNRMPQIREGQEGGDKIQPQNIPESRKTFAPPPAVKFPRADKTASLEKNVGKLTGTVVFDDRITPRAGAKLLFVSTDKQGPQEPVTADQMGNFRISLAKGEWLMYVEGKQGKPEFHSKLSVEAQDDRSVTVVSR